MSVDSKESNCTMKEELVQGPSSTCDSVALGGATFSSERRNQQAISMELSSDESCCSTGNNQARDQAGITHNETL